MQSTCMLLNFQKCRIYNLVFWSTPKINEEVCYIRLEIPGYFFGCHKCLALHNNNYLHYALYRAQTTRCILRRCPAPLRNLPYTLTLFLAAQPRHTCSHCLRRVSSLQKLKKSHHTSLRSSAQAMIVKQLLMYSETVPRTHFNKASNMRMLISSQKQLMCTRCTHSSQVKPFLLSLFVKNMKFADNYIHLCFRSSMR